MLFILGMTSQTYAGEDVQGRKIIDIGCHRDIGTCYVTLDGPAFGSSLKCLHGATNQFRFDDSDSVNGRRAYASLLAAFLQGKTVDVFLDGCSVQGAPLMQYFHIK
ncbi:hypothetical protein [Acinetobacter dispersus]|uniref:hypothetical protein n=1 Tax=Acinetobacter dispersus TaxID=70348 RepID=UPI001D18B2DB|nr:hypothetical protein [Acinetobacter dispersus]